jgi:TaqI-like C-terminal specificity domain/N-6 DNA Methylase
MAIPTDRAQKLEELRELVNKFRNNISQFTDKNYKEQRLRQDFVNEFFELLDWDIRNKAQLMESLREVVIEDNLEVSGTQKYPDYTFRWGDHPFFFVETKKPSIDIKNDTDSAFQVRRYGYSAKLKISILTDFQELAIYDTRTKPNKNDKAITARLRLFTYEQYEENWDYIYGLLAKGNVISGSIDKEIGSGAKKGTSEVDKDFLEFIEKWRSELARSIARNNKKADLDSINMAVQKIIDRIIFLRICEDKGIEQYENLLNLGKDEKNMYEQLAGYFDKANKKYNSELFKPDSFINELKIDNEVLADIIKGLYYPCPYAFSVLPVEILGNIYEQFLGKTIHLTETHQARIEEKPEVRKAGGVYYTPKYIVDYIVKNTVGEKIKGLAPKEIEKIKILDPACGSGSFLLGAYASLLNYHLSYYVKKENLPKALKNGAIYPAKKDSYKLTIKEKQKVLLNNIFGVDIDAQAVEVTKLSLMLKLLEGESDESAGMLFKYSDTKLLPTLSDNIKCGNSLIGPDFYKEEKISLFDDRELKKKVNVFDWLKEFSEIFKSGGFDCVIGNPPWVSLSGKFGNDILSEQELAYLTSKYHANTYMPNLYEYFIWKGLELMGPDGLFSFIVPDRLGFNEQFVNLRKSILDNSQIISLTYKARFPDIVADTLIFVFKKSKVKSYMFNVGEFDKELHKKSIKEYYDDKDLYFAYQADNEIAKVLKKIDSIKNKRLILDVFETTSGFGGKSDCITDERVKASQIRIIKGKNIERYYINGSLFFEFKRENITGRTTDKEKLGAKTKILLRKTGFPIYATFDESGIFPEQSLYFLFNKKTEESYLFYLAIINSKVFQFYYWNRLVTNRDSTPQLKKIHLDIFPVPSIDFSVSKQKEGHHNIIGLVDQMLETQKKAHSSKTESDKKHYQQKIEIIDKQIDELVYELYGLTKEEIAVVEERKTNI